MPKRKLKSKPYRQTPAEDRVEIGNIRKWGRSEDLKHPTAEPRFRRKLISYRGSRRSVSRKT